MSMDADATDRNAKTRHQRLRELFDAALNLAAPAQITYIEQHCAGDVALANELMQLLALERALDGQKTHKPELSLLATLDALDDRYWLGRSVGRYQIVQRLGVGGMGQVFLAQRCDGDIAQQLALKIIRRDGVSASMLRRFLDESQILASLKHPSIAHFIDAGVDASGLPYFVMEFVEGQNLTGYCRAHNLGISERLILFRQVLDAVRYAHRNLIIHRDLKPNNILVNGDGQAKLLDFGIAKIVDPMAAKTATAERAFTFEYAAPEQLIGAATSLSCDIYSLGALLYELLSGAPPFSAHGLAPRELEELVLKHPPKSLRTRYQIELQRLGAISPAEQKTAAKWKKSLNHDLEAIVQQALRKEPDARYQTVADFDADLSAFLGKGVVRASGGGRAYRTRKFIERNRLACALSLLLLLSLLSAFGVVLQQNLAIRKERDRAESALQVLQDAFVAADPARVAGGTSTARQILAHSVQRITALRTQQPENFVALGNRLAEVELALGLLEDARVLAHDIALTAAQIGDYAAISRARRVEISALVGASQFSMAQVLIELETKTGEANDPQLWLAKGQLYTQTDRVVLGLEAIQKGIALQAPNPNNAEWVMAYWKLADAYRLNGQFDLAKLTLDQHVVRLEASLGANHLLTLRTKLYRMDQLRRMKFNADALRLGPVLIQEIVASYGKNSSFSARAQASYANALIAQNKYSEALVPLKSAVRAYQSSLGATNETTLRTRFNLAQILARQEATVLKAQAQFARCIQDAGQANLIDTSLLAFFRFQFANFLAHEHQSARALHILTEALSVAQVEKMQPADRAEYAQQIQQRFVESGCDSTLPPSSKPALICHSGPNKNSICQGAKLRYCTSFGFSTR